MLPPPVVQLIVSILELLNLAIIIWVVMSLLINFEVINRFNQFVKVVYNFLEQLLNPMLKPIRKVVPVIGGIDLSPLVLLLGVQFLQGMIIYYL